MQRLVVGVLRIDEGEMPGSTSQESVEKHGFAKGVKRQQSRKLK
jgi:hypothetical protein